MQLHFYFALHLEKSSNSMAQFPNLGRKKLFTYVLFPLFLHILENYFESADKNITNIQNDLHDHM